MNTTSDALFSMKAHINVDPAVEAWRARYAPLDVSLYTMDELQNALAELPLKKIASVLSDIKGTHHLIKYLIKASEMYPERTYMHIKEVASWVIHYNGPIDCEGAHQLTWSNVQKQRFQWKNDNRLWRSSSNRHTLNYAALTLLDLPFKIQSADIKNVSELFFIDQAIQAGIHNIKTKEYYSHLIATVCNQYLNGLFKDKKTLPDNVIELWRRYARWDDWVKSFFYTNHNHYNYLTPYHGDTVQHLLRMDYIVNYLNSKEEGMGNVLRGLYLMQEHEAHAVPAWHKISEEQKAFYRALSEKSTTFEEIPLSI